MAIEEVDFSTNKGSSVSLLAAFRDILDKRKRRVELRRDAGRRCELDDKTEADVHRQYQLINDLIAIFRW